MDESKRAGLEARGYKVADELFDRLGLDLLLRTYFATGAPLEDLSDLLLGRPTA